MMNIAILGCNTPVGLELAERVPLASLYIDQPLEIRYSQISVLYIAFDDSVTFEQYKQFIYKQNIATVYFVYSVHQLIQAIDLIDYIKTEFDDYYMIELPEILYGLGVPMSFPNASTLEYSIYNIADLAYALLEIEPCKTIRVGSEPISYHELISAEPTSEGKERARSSFKRYTKLAESIIKIPTSLAITDASWIKELNTIAIRICQKYGINKFEIDITKYMDWFIMTPKRIKDLQQGQIIALGKPFASRLENIFTHRSEFITHMLKAIQYAHLMGVKYIIFNTPMNRYLPISMSIHTAHKTFIETMETIGKFAETYQVTLCIEAITRQNGCNYITDNGVLEEIINVINSPYIKAVYKQGTGRIENPDLVGYHYTYTIPTTPSDQQFTLVTKTVASNAFTLAENLKDLF